MNLSKLFMSFFGGQFRRGYCREPTLFIYQNTFLPSSGEQILPMLPSESCAAATHTVPPPWLWGWACNQGLATHSLHVVDHTN